MPYNICKRCSGTLEIKNGRKYCPYCGCTELNSFINGEEESRLHTGIDLLNQCKFKDAQKHFEHFIKDFPKNLQGLWNYLLSLYRIKYVKDVPTFYDTEIEKKVLLFDDNSIFKTKIEKLLKSGNYDNKEGYYQLATIIDNTIKEWQQIKKNPDNCYDIFISFKDDEKNLDGTISPCDYKLANNIYNNLLRVFGKKYRIFFAPVSLNKIAGKEYNSYIYNALNTSKMMILCSSKSDYAKTDWVQNEWERFVWQRNNSEGNDAKRIYIICNDPSNLPVDLSGIQTYDTQDGQYIISLIENVKENFDMNTRKPLSFEGGNETKETPVLPTIDRSYKVDDEINIDEKNKIALIRNNIASGVFDQAKKNINDLKIDNQEYYLLRLLIDNEYLCIGDLINNFEAFWANENNKQNLEKCFNYRECDKELLDGLTKKCISALENDYLEIFSAIYDIISTRKEASGVHKNVFGLLLNKVGINQMLVMTCADKVISFLSADNDDKIDNDLYVKHLNILAHKCLEKSQFLDSKKLYEEAIVYCKNKDLLKKSYFGLLYATMEIINSRELESGKGIDKLKNIDVVINLCSTLDKQTQQFVLKRIALSSIVYIEKCNEYDEHVYNNFVKLIDYIDSDEVFNKLLYAMAMSSLKFNRFYDAKMLFQKIISIDKNNVEYKAHWGALKCELGCCNDDEILSKEELIKNIKEYNNACKCAINSGHEKESKYYMEMSKKQEIAIEKRRKEKKLAKKKRIRKMLIIISIVLLCISIALSVGLTLLYKSEKKIKYSESDYDGYSVYVGKRFDEEDVVIPSSKDGQPIVAIADYAFENNTTIKTLVLPTSLISIGKGAFKGCTNLETITFENVSSDLIAYADEDAESVPLLKYVGESAFENCASLKSFDFSTVEEIGDYAFKSSGLESIALSSSIKKIGTNAFDNSQIETVELYCFLENTKGLFNSCERLISIEIFGNDAVSYYKENEKCLIDKIEDGERKVVFNYYKDINVDNQNGDELKIINVNISELVTVDAPRKEGYKFLGYYTNFGHLNIKVTDENGKSIVDSFQSILNIYAKWEANTNVITFDPNGGAGEVYTQEIKTDAIEKLKVCSFIKEKCAFKGWSTSKKGEVEYLDEADFKMGAQPSYTLYAIWGGVEYAIEYQLDGGINSVNNPSTFFAEEKEIVLAEPKKDGYTFLGWSETNSYNSIITSIKANTNNNVILYALWQKGEILFSYEDSGYSVNGYLGDSTDIIIPKYHLNKTVNSIGSNAFNRCLSIYSITIPDGVTSIGEQAFYGCSNLTNIAIPKSVTNMSSSSIFEDCISLKNIVIPNGITSIGSYMFDGCTSLTSITIPSGVTNIGNSAFRNCSNLKSVSLPYSIKEIGQYAFGRCSSLTSVALPNSTKEISKGLFNCCYCLQNVTIPSGVTTINSEAFWGCSNLTKITIPNSVTSIGDNAFFNCTKLIEVCNKSTLKFSIGDKNYGNIGYYAKNIYTDVTDSKLVNYNDYLCYVDGNTKELISYLGSNDSLSIPYVVTSIGSYAFINNLSIKEIKISSSVTTIGESAFDGCENLQNVTIAYGVKKINDSAFRDCINITTITIPSSIESIKDYAFYGCVKLVEIYNKSKLDIIKGSSTHGCVGCYAKNIYTNANESKMQNDNDYLYYIDGNTKEIVSYRGNSKNVIIPEDVTSIGSCAFYNCKEIVSITIPDSVTNIGSGAFYGCISLNEIGIPSGVTSINSGTFYCCYSLKNILIPYGVTSIGNEVFYGCFNLINVVIPESVKYIGSGAFCGCERLQSVTIPEGVDTIHRETFRYCISLKNITIPYGVTTIGYYAFYCCYSLKDLIIPESTTNIYDYAFGSCKSLTTLLIPEGVTNINRYAFNNCINLTSISLPSTLISIGDSAFSSCNKLVEVFNKSKLNLVAGSTSNGYIGFCAKNIYILDGGNKLSIQNGGIYYFDEGKSFVGLEKFDSFVTIKEGTTIINKYAFNYDSTTNRLLIPSSVAMIENQAFNNCSHLIEIYYEGTISEWKEICKANVPSSTSVYYYSATKPANSGYYWHYDENDNVEIW